MSLVEQKTPVWRAAAGQWVFCAESRGERPFVAEERTCPFCAENAGLLTKVEARRGENGEIRAFANKYPANEGFHEVVADTFEHYEALEHMSNEHLAETLSLLIERRDVILGRGALDCAVFKNNGAKAGASISHSHWQVAGLPFVTDFQRNLRERVTADGGAFLKSQLADRDLIIWDNGAFAAFSPREPRFPLETWIAPFAPIGDMRETTAMERAAFSECLRMAVSALVGATEVGLNYNIIFQNAGAFFAQIVPRRTVAGFAGIEIGFDAYINTVSPQNAAAELRRVAAGNGFFAG